MTYKTYFVSYVKGQLEHPFTASTIENTICRIDVDIPIDNLVNSILEDISPWSPSEIVLISISPLN